MTIFNFKLLLICLVCYQCVSATDDVKDDSENAARDPGALWFGPRLGKRSLKISNEDNRQSFLRLLEAADALKYYYDQLPYYTKPDDPDSRVTKKVIFTPKLGRSLNSLYPEKRGENVEFTPRLGRRLRLTEDVAVPRDMESFVVSYKPDSEQDRQYLASRLGRNVNFSPRLGRELNSDIYPENIRLTRSTNDTRST